MYLQISSHFKEAEGKESESMGINAARLARFQLLIAIDIIEGSRRVPSES